MALRETDIHSGLYTLGFLIASGARELSFARENVVHLSLLILRLNSDKIDISGDLLSSLGHVVTQYAGETSVTARTGENELAVLLPGFDSTRAAGCAYRIRKSVSTVCLKNLGIHDNEIKIGVASMSDDTSEISDLINKARDAVVRSRSVTSLVITR